MTPASRPPVSGTESPAHAMRLLRPWHAFWRSRSGFVLWRLLVGIFGSSLVLTGLALVPLPGPGWLIVFAGLAVLGLEFAFARALLSFTQNKVASWSRWVMSRPWPLRAFLGLLSVVAALAFAAAAMRFSGFAHWLPAPVNTAFDSFFTML